MKKIICLIVVMVLFSAVFAGCRTKSNSDSVYKKAREATTASQTEEPTTAKATEKPTEKQTVPPTEKPTEAPTEAPKPKEYTAEELLKKSVPEILAILDYDIIVECNGTNSNYGGSTDSICFYNFTKLPGFVFSPKGVVYQPTETDLNDVKNDILSDKYEDLSFIAIKGNAKVNDLFSADMTYNEISSKTGNYSTQPPAGQGLITQNLSDYCNNCKLALVTYETSREAIKHMSDDGYDSDYLKQENPKTMYIIAYR